MLLTVSDTLARGLGLLEDGYLYDDEQPEDGLVVIGRRGHVIMPQD